jgi:hypothetical protein
LLLIFDEVSVAAEKRASMLKALNGFEMRETEQFLLPDET